MMMMRCKSKSHYTSLWVLLSPLTDNCIGLWCYESDSLALVLFFMVRPDMIFGRTGANTLDFLWCPFVSHGGQTELRLRDSDRKKREKKLMLINGEEWRRGEQNQISFMRIFTGPLLSFLFILFFQKKRIMRLVLLLKGWWVTQGRLSGERWTEMTSLPYHH